jgi:hypothetical protein
MFRIRLSSNFKKVKGPMNDNPVSQHRRNPNRRADAMKQWEMDTIRERENTPHPLVQSGRTAVVSNNQLSAQTFGRCMRAKGD